MAQQLDRSKPLWEIWVVEGLEDGRWAMLSKTHHAMVDGVSGTDLLAVIMDSQPRRRTGPAPVGVGRRAPSRPALELVVEALDEHGAQPLRAAAGGPGRRPGALRQAAALRRRGGRAALVAHGGPGPAARPSRASTVRSGPHRRYAWADHVGRGHQARCARSSAARSTTSCWPRITNGFRELLLSRGEDVDRVVRTLVPVSVRAAGRVGQAVGDGTYENKVSAMFAELPVEHRRPGRCACTPSPTR